MILLLLILILSYIAGSIPTAIIAGKIILKDDIRNHGSKNAGATNVYRVMGWKPALIVVLIDIGKGLLAVLLIAQLRPGHIAADQTMIRILAGTAAIAGHIWTVFAGFKGGKGVGTAFGVLLGIAPFASVLTFAVWLILVLTTRIVSVGSIAAGLVFPAALAIQRWGFGAGISDPVFIMGVFLGLLVIFTHRTNIARLIKGQENRFGSKNKEE